MRRHIILIKDGELLPIQKGTPTMRMGNLAQALLGKGARVTWLATTWSHQFKSKIANEGLINVSKNYDVQLLECGSYTKNVSIKRIIHHRNYGLKVKAFLEALSDKPDAIVCALPIPSVCAEAAKYCKKHDISFVLDVRDLWPDVFEDKLGAIGNFLAKPLIVSQKRDLEFSISTANLVTAVSNSYLDWAKNHDEKFALKSNRNSSKFRHLPIGAQLLDKKNAAPSGDFKKILKGLKGKIFFSFIGSFGKSYDLSLIISAAEHFEKKGVDDVHFLVAGDGQQKALIEQAALKYKNISYCGWLDAKNSSALLAMSDVGIMPLQSVAGTFPNKPFQYMSAGLPIISSLEGEFAHFLKNENVGLNFSQGNVSEFIDAIDEMRAEKLRSEMSKSSIRIFKNRFEQSKIYSDFAESVIDLINTKN